MGKIAISGIYFEVPAPYGEGHVLSRIEAGVLNQSFAENLRNNFAKKVKAVQEKYPEATGVPDDEQQRLNTEFAEYASGYTFSAAGGARAPSDPVGKEAYRMAKDLVDEQLRARNLDKKSLPEGRYEILVDQVAAKESVVAEAKRRVESIQVQIEDLSIEPEAPAEPQPAAAAAE